MAIQKIEASYSVANLSAPANIPIDIPLDDGTISQIDVYIGDAMDGGDAKFNFGLNGVDLFTGSSRWIIVDGDQFVSKAALSQVSVRGDYLTFVLEELTGGTVVAPIMVYVTYDDGVAVTAAEIHAATGKTTPVDADELGIVDSAASNALKKLTWANLKATLKTYLDTLYQPLSSILTALVALSPSNDDFLQRKAGAWTNRTIAQVKTDLSLSGTNTGDQTTVSGNAGTATALQTARTIDGQSFDGTANITVIAPGTHAASSKSTPVDADEVALVDSVASNVLKKLTWANLKATLKTYFDTLYLATSAIDDTAYDSTTWDGDTTHAPSKNAVRDKIEALILAGGGYTDEQAQDAIGAMVDSSLNYVDATPLLQRSALTGDVTASAGSNATTIPNNTVTYAKMQDVSATSKVIGRKTSGSGDPEECSLSDILDFIGSAAQGDILYRGSSAWERLAAGTSGQFLKTQGSGANPIWADIVGKQTIYVPASAMISATTNGPSSAQLESTTNKLNYSTLDFDGTTQEYAHFQVAFPKNWDEGTVTFKAFWSTTNTGTAGVAIGLQGIATSDADTIDTAFGTAVYVTDAGQSSAAKQYVTAESGAVTIAGSPAEGDMVYFRVTRDPANGSDTMSEDMRLIGIQLFFTTNATA
jgi:hypothetical protein